jgi:pimeloyl-ACP methyl ester carboxylesterase
MSAIVLVHAFGSSRRGWTPQLRGLGDRYQVLAPDLPGHGDAPGPFTMDRAVESVRSAIEEGSDETHLVGLSGGAVVSLLAYLEHPTAVAGVVLSGGLARPPRWFALQRAMTRIAPEPMLARMLGGALSGGSAEYAQAAGEDFRRCGKRTFLAALRELAHVDLRPRLGQIAAPTLVLCGANDRPNLPLSRELAAGIPGAELRVVPAANHIWNLQQPQAFNETVAAFVEQPARSGG